MHDFVFDEHDLAFKEQEPVLECNDGKILSLGATAARFKRAF